MSEVIVDSFAGGGGASTGIEIALGRSPDLAINHDADAIRMHRTNHPTTRHLNSNIFRVDPRDHVRRGDVGLAWFSPDCKHFSKAKGGAPIKRNIRDLAWVVVHWAELVRPRVIILENVEEFQDWGPVDVETNRPIRERAGETFKEWIRKFRRAGYKVEWQELRACDYGAPTIRKRLFVIARCDGEPIVWPEPTHGRPTNPRVIAGELLPWRTAAEIIDWSLPCPSIFLTREEAKAINVRRPLADATMARIAKGVVRYVLEAAEPFIVSVAHGDSGGRREYGTDEPLGTIHAGGTSRAVIRPSFVTFGQHGGANRPADAPLHTVTASTKDTNCLVSGTLIQTGYGERPGQSPRVPGLDKPLGTVVAGGSKHALVAGFLAQHNTGLIGHDARKPISTIVGKGCTQAVVAGHLMSLHGAERRAAAATDPLRTITAGGGHASLVAAFLTKYYGVDQAPWLTEPMHTITTRDRFSLVTVSIDGTTYVLDDIGMRMLTPRELFAAQGFPDTYLIDMDDEGVPFSKAAQIRMCGNSVCPDLAAALVTANCADLAIDKAAA